jgi:predicted lipid-binding transport protein (Tim44 family)
MHRHTLLASTLALLLAGTTSFAIAQDAAPAPRATTAAPASPAPSTTPMHHMAKDRGSHDRGMRGGMMHGGMMRGEMGAFSDLRSIERLYQQAGRGKEMASVYNDVLAKSQNPMLRTYVYHRLARLQAQPANVDQAIGTLRKSLDENLANEAKMRAEHEQMRAQWQQRAAAKAPAAR